MHAPRAASRYASTKLPHVRPGHCDGDCSILGRLTLSALMGRTAGARAPRKSGLLHPLHRTIAAGTGNSSIKERFARQQKLRVAATRGIGHKAAHHLHPPTLLSSGVPSGSLPVLIGSHARARSFAISSAMARSLTCSSSKLNSVGSGMFCSTVLKKLFSESVKVSSQGRVKYISKVGWVSGFLTKGSTARGQAHTTGK